MALVGYCDYQRFEADYAFTYPALGGYAHWYSFYSLNFGFCSFLWINTRSGVNVNFGSRQLL